MWLFDLDYAKSKAVVIYSNPDFGITPTLKS